MRCPFCKQDKDKVIDTRPAEDGFAIRRRRKCLGCDRRFTTYERIGEMPLRVIKKDGTRVPFDREKLIRGIEKACWNLPVSTEAIDEIATKVELDSIEAYEQEVPSSYIGERVMAELKNSNQVAYVRFASVYREFKDIGEFMEVLKHMLQEKSRDK